MKIQAAVLEAFCLDALRSVGVGDADARTATDALVTADTWGTFTHGTKLLRGYVRRLRGGGLRRDGRPRVVAEGPAWARVDGDSSLGAVTSVFAMRVAMAKAKTAGIGYAGVFNTCHFGAAGYYASLAAAENLIGIVMANDIPTVNVPGARRAVLGSNPFAFAAPAGDERPILFDIATSTVAGGKVFAAAARGQSIPGHWLLDADARPTTDPEQFSQGGSLTPMAGYKGYGFAFMVETLSAILTGAAITGQVRHWMFSDPSQTTGHGTAFLAVNIESMMPAAEFRKRMDQTIREVRASEKAPGAGRVWLPGEMEWERRERALAEGLELPSDVIASLHGLAEDLGLDFSRLGC